MSYYLSYPPLDTSRCMSIYLQVFLQRGGGRPEVWHLAMSLRYARLANSAYLPIAYKQSLAVETLQIWAPLSFQVSAQQWSGREERFVILSPY